MCEVVVLAADVECVGTACHLAWLDVTGGTGGGGRGVGGGVGFQPHVREGEEMKGGVKKKET